MHSLTLARALALSSASPFAFSRSTASAFSGSLTTSFLPGKICCPKPLVIRGTDCLFNRKPIVNLVTYTKTGMAEAAEEAMDAVQRRLMFEDECILVDKEDHVIGHESKYNCHLMEKIESENLLHRAFSVFLFNTKYELLLQQRSGTKVTFPLVWTNTCCSHPLYRQSELIEENNLGVKNAAQRKLYDELGIVAEDVPVDQFVPLGRILYKAPSDGKWGEHELDYLVFIVRDVALHPNPEEVADVKYVTKEQLKEIVRKADAGEDGIKLSPWFRLVVDNFLFDWWNKVENGTLSEAVDMSIHNLT
uniref:isopentenyl-diphosphate Delta-isomerase n=1 Tax=Araucaria cunninghamii TaxID=56994 RepID=A0A0D6QYK3_ARACU